MNRIDLVLAGLAAGGSSLHTPVQIQKLFFLIDRNIGEAVGGPHFNFEPYSYGPFDKSIYSDLRALTQEGLVEPVPDRNWISYRLTERGQERAGDLLGRLPEPASDYIRRASHFVRTLSFQKLVAAIYQAYPEMRSNSVFQG